MVGVGGVHGGQNTAGNEWLGNKRKKTRICKRKNKQKHKEIKNNNKKPKRTTNAKSRK